MVTKNVYLTPTYLSSLFRKETGKTISEYIIEVRIEKSKELLKKQRVKLFEIAREVGYSDANYFAKVFKMQIGLTPSEYREKYTS
jgi:two-component system response regulator YesN